MTGTISHYCWWTQSLILYQMMTFEGGLNLIKIEADGFVTVTLHQPKR